jgi:hypothetical protein
MRKGEGRSFPPSPIRESCTGKLVLRAIEFVFVREIVGGFLCAPGYTHYGYRITNKAFDFSYAGAFLLLI